MRSINGSQAPGSGRQAPNSARRYGAYRLGAQEEEIIKVSFESFSEEIILDEKTGEKGRCIMTSQLKEAFQAIGAESDIHDVQLLIDDIDMNGDGRVDENEWRQIMMRKFLGEDDDSSIMHIFSMLDDNKDGYIPLVELRSILMREGQSPLSEQEVDELLMFADVESDGLINYRTFLRWLSAPQAVRKKEEEPPAEAPGPKAGQPEKPGAQPPLPGPTEPPPTGSLPPADGGAAPGAPPAEAAPAAVPKAKAGSSPPQGSPSGSEAGDRQNRGRRGRRPAPGAQQG